MPKIDTDLFQVLALALLFLSLLSLLAALSVLSGIKKKLDARDSFDSPASTPQAVYQPEPVATAYTPAATYTAPAVTQAPQETQEVSTGFVSMAEAAPAEPATSAAAAPALRGDEPEEQPFERDGRWWFKRGGELLVYDEGTGQWVAAGSAAATGSLGSPVAGAATGVQIPLVTTGDAGEGWKCSSCGAVNGSTATSCRMCFAPR